LGRKEDNIQKAKAIMDDPEHIRNIGIAAHIDHGKTTLTDNLLAGAGMMSEELAGEQLAMDFDEQEQERGITIDSASASMVHDYDDREFLINLIDTPGHVDFGGDVTRAMRAVDGAVIVVDAVEGVMPQTETVVRQALREKVKPVLFINKVDRLINELQVTPEEMQRKFSAVISEVNELIDGMVPEEFEGKWNVAVEDGSVAFGSALYNWAINVPYMEQSGVTFEDIYEWNRDQDFQTLHEEAPVHEVLLNMVIDHLPQADVAQEYRIPTIWEGDYESEVGEAMIETDPSGPATVMITKIMMDEHAGEVAFGRVFSGAVTEGQDLHIIGMPEPNRTQQVAVMVGNDRVTVDEVVAGNIVAMTGLKDAIAGSTVTTVPDMVPFEKMVHVSEPVVTVAVEAKHTKDLPKLIEVLHTVSKADPSIDIEIDQETGEHLMSGMGELHLEITEHRIREDHEVEVETSPPIVVYRETVEGTSPREFEGKSPNRHNKFYFTVEPLDDTYVDLIHEGEIPEGKVKKQDARELSKVLADEHDLDREEIQNIRWVTGKNIFMDDTRGVQYLDETIELVQEAFEEVMEAGPRAEEPCRGVMVRLHDASLHEDAIHRGPSQVIPATRNAIRGAMTEANDRLLEPMQKVYIDVPSDVMGEVTRELQQRRGEIIDMDQEGDLTTIEAKAPVGEMFGFSNSIRSATGGQALWSTEHAGFDEVPNSLHDEITREVRERKGLKPEPKTAEEYWG
jgi:elongation factor 2